MDFPGNSHRPLSNPHPKESAVPKEKVEKVVTGSVVVRKKPLGQRIKHIFFGGELKSVTRYIGSDVLIPAFRKLIVEATSTGIERMIYGESSTRRRPMESNRSRYSYNTPVDRSRVRGLMLPDQPPYSAARQQEPNEIILVSRADAEIVIDTLTDIVDKVGAASVSDLHELVGLPSTHVDLKWGWTNLAYVEIRQVREGYLLELPPVETI